jgi:hypothetical protein
VFVPYLWKSRGYAVQVSLFALIMAMFVQNGGHTDSVSHHEKHPQLVRSMDL